MRINEGGSGGFGGDIDGIGGLVRGFGGAGLRWFVVARIGITEVRGFSGLRMLHLSWAAGWSWAVGQLDGKDMGMVGAMGNCQWIRAVSWFGRG